MKGVGLPSFYFYMYMPRPVFVNEKFYHIYNRGVEKRKIFMDDLDYLRFVHDLFEFNDKNIVLNILRRLPNSEIEGSPTPFNRVRRPRELLIDIICYCLMPNHYHLFLRQRAKGGISKFIQKLGGGYTNYFNLKYARNGVLFQGKFNAVPVDTDIQFIHISRYIHLNPVELLEPDWKEKGIKDWKKIKKFLESYRWSSYLDYIGKKNFPSLIKRDFLFNYFDNEKEYQKFVKEWALKDTETIKDLAME